MPSKVFFGEAGGVLRPSPSIWGDCPLDILTNFGNGVFIHKDFAGEDGTPPGLATDEDAGSTFAYSTAGSHSLDVAVTNTDNNAAAIFTRPLGRIVKSSGNRFWAEASVALAAIADQGVFFGLAEADALDRDVIADNAGAVDTESVVGFLQAADDTDAFDALYRLNAETVVEVLGDVTNASGIPAADRGALTADTFVKLGLRYDGRDTIEFYVNGYKVAEQELDDTVDQSKSYGVILAVKTGAAAARTIRAEFFRAAFHDATL